MELSINELLFALGSLVKAAERGNEEALQSLGYTVVDFAAIGLAKNAIETFNGTASDAEAALEVNPAEPSSTHWPAKCPITRRDFFMEIDGVPTYGGPYDSYTIPEMTGDPNEPFHKRELVVRRYDHDGGGWLEDELETIPLRIIHDNVLNELQDLATAFIEISLNEEVEEGLLPTEPGHGSPSFKIVEINNVVESPHPSAELYRHEFFSAEIVPVGSELYVHETGQQFKVAYVAEYPNTESGVYRHAFFSADIVPIGTKMKVRTLEVAKDMRPTEPGWVMTHPRYGKWFISREAVAADWKQDHEQAYPDEPVSEPDEETVDSWFYEQISWYEVSVYGKQLERPNTAAIEVKWLREMANDADEASRYSEIA